MTPDTPWPLVQIGDLSPDRAQFWNGEIWGWQRLWLVPDEVITVVAARFGQAATGAVFLASGLLNQSWRIESEQGRYVLRVSRSERTRPQLAYEHAVLNALHARISAVVPPLPGIDGKTMQLAHGYVISLFPFIAGISGDDVPAAIRSAAAAVTLARIHRVSIEHLHVPQRPGSHSVDGHPRWIWPEIEPVLQRALAPSPEVAPACAAIEREIASLDAWLDDLAADGRLQPRALVHGDFNPRNLIFDGDRLTAIIDWDDCRVEPVAWEVAQAAFAPDVDPRVFWRTYRDAGGPLAERDLDLLGGFARLGALSEVRWTLDGHGHVTPHAPQQLRDVVQNVAWLRAREASVIG